MAILGYSDGFNTVSTDDSAFLDLKSFKIKKKLNGLFYNDTIRAFFIFNK